MIMNPLIIFLGLVLVNLAAASVLLQHRRKLRRQRARMPVIGSDPKLTKALHARLTANAPITDWLNPANLRAKVNAWHRSQS